MPLAPLVCDILKTLDHNLEPVRRDTLLIALVQALARQFDSANEPPMPAWQPHTRYPTDDEGYAVAFDPITETDAFVHHWQTYGMVVGKHVVDPALLDAARARMHEVMLRLSHGACDLDKPSTYGDFPQDMAGVPFVSRGFFELYHDAVLAAIRQSPAMYVHHALIWQRADLWTSFDRLGFKPPEHADAVGLPLHVDQNPLVHADFKTVQGVLALEDCPLERGTFVGVPTSRALFAAYAPHVTNAGEYVELPVGSDLHAQVGDSAQALPLRKGCLVSWDSRTTHANSSNLSALPRYVMYVAAGPAREENATLVGVRKMALKTGEGSNVREALMHASKKPRFSDIDALATLRQPEALTALGRLLYGLDAYSEVAFAAAAA